MELDQLHFYCRSLAQRSFDASQELASISGQIKNAWIRRSAALLLEQKASILAENAKDVDQAYQQELSPPKIDRLRLSEKLLTEMSQALEEIAMFPDPVGEIIESSIRPAGFEVQKVRVPLGVVFFIYESRPNVTADAAAICVKSGNAVILRGGKEALHSNLALASILQTAAQEIGLPKNAVQLVETTDHAAVGEFLQMSDLINVTIPRGGETLIRRVAEEAKMPVIKHFTGNCHIYIDEFADAEIAESVLINSKCQRYSPCNAAESLVVHKNVLTSLFPRLIQALKSNNVEIRGDETAQKYSSDIIPASENDFYTEYLAPIISVSVVSSLEEAIRHINKYGSHHTDAIITQNLNAARIFAAKVDSASVMINASTRLDDGGQYGLGAEIGISTDKFHARGPCGIKELTTYKYVVYGNGHLRF